MSSPLLETQANTFHIFDAEPTLKANYLFCFVGIILFFLLTVPTTVAITFSRGRARLPSLLLLFATLLFMVYYATEFAGFAEGPLGNRNLSPNAYIGLSSGANQAYFTGEAFMLWALLLLNNYTYGGGKGEASTQNLGKPFRLAATILIGLFFFTGTVETITFAILDVHAENGEGVNEFVSQDRASNGLSVVERILIYVISICLLVWSYKKSKGTTEHPMHTTLRLATFPILIAGSLAGVVFSIVNAIVFDQFLNIQLHLSESSFNKIDHLGSILNSNSAGGQITQGLVNFLVILLASVGAASALRNTNRSQQDAGLELLPKEQRDV